MFIAFLGKPYVVFSYWSLLLCILRVYEHDLFIDFGLFSVIIEIFLMIFLFIQS